MGDGEYWFELLPATTLTFWPNPDGDDVYVGGDPYLLQEDIWVVDVPAEDAAYASLYRVLPGEDPGNGGEDPATGTGSLVIEQVDCEYGTDPSVDTSTCALSSQPWEVTLTNTATGETYSLLNDGWAYDSGTWVIEALPAGNYAISVHANGNWEILGPAPSMSGRRRNLRHDLQRRPARAVGRLDVLRDWRTADGAKTGRHGVGP